MRSHRLGNGALGSPVQSSNTPQRTACGRGSWSDIDLEKKVIRWRAENDKIGFLHTTPLSTGPPRRWTGSRRQREPSGEHWVFLSDVDPSPPLPRHTANKWWRRAEVKAEVDHVPGMGFHSARRKFALGAEKHESPGPRLHGGLEKSADGAHRLPTARHGIAARGFGCTEEVESDGLGRRATDTTNRHLDGSVRKRRNPVALFKCKRDNIFQTDGVGFEPTVRFHVHTFQA